MNERYMVRPEVFQVTYLIHFVLELLEVMLLIWMLVLVIAGRKVQKS